MPNITTETARETYTISGESFSFPQPYDEGHTLTAGEASQLNQVFAENIRNNLAAQVKAAKDAGTFDATAFQATVDQYADEYEMGVRRSGGRTSDPVEAEALSIARGKVEAKLREKYGSLKDIKAGDITSLAKDVLAKYPDIRELARQRVESANSIEISFGEDTPAPSAKAKKNSAPAETVEA